jgi:hypothetical protein
MPYVLQIITPADQIKILSDADGDINKKRALLARGGYLANKPGLKWAVDRERDSYLFRAPKPPMSQEYYYYFFFDGSLREVQIRSPVDAKSYFSDPLPTDPAELCKVTEALQQAFFVLGIDGRHIAINIAGRDE